MYEHIKRCLEGRLQRDMQREFAFASAVWFPLEPAPLLNTEYEQAREEIKRLVKHAGWEMFYP